MRDDNERKGPDWSAILVDGVAKAGGISDAYRRFWHYLAP
jgi:hypothetical protein